MIYSVTGNLIHTDLNSAVIDVNGVAFRCFVTANTLRKIGEIGKPASLLTYLNVKEDALDLYGFKEQSELDCFKLLLEVKGVGPKAALSILSQLTPDRLALAVAAKDVKSISAAQGIGKKTAEMVVLVLKDKLSGIVSDEEASVELEMMADAAVNDNVSDAVNALVSLGYTQTDATKILSKADASMSTEDLIKFALKKMM